jgi:hypothetical protein
VADPGAGTHRLHVSGVDGSDVALVVAVGDGSVVDVGDDLNVRVMVKREARMRLDLVIVEDDEISHRLVSRIAIRPDGEMTSGPEPPGVRAGDFVT